MILINMLVKYKLNIFKIVTGTKNGSFIYDNLKEYDCILTGMKNIIMY